MGKRQRLSGAEMTAEGERKAEADAAWRAHLHRPAGAAPLIQGTPAADAHAEEGRALEVRYGEPRWDVLLYASAEEQAKAERIIAARTRRAPAEVY